MRYQKNTVEKEFCLRDESWFERPAYKHKGKTFPHIERARWWMSSEENRSLLSETVSAVRRALKMRPVQSNADLIQRIDEYMSIIEDRRVPPTMEEFGLYLGYTSAWVLDVIDGVNFGFPDAPYPGCSTSILLKQAVEALHAMDAVQVMRKMSDNVSYIFRSKNYYGMRDTKETAVNVNIKMPDALPPEEIAKLLPELTQDRSMTDVTVRDDGDDLLD